MYLLVELKDGIKVTLLRLMLPLSLSVSVSVSLAISLIQSFHYSERRHVSPKDLFYNWPYALPMWLVP